MVARSSSDVRIVPMPIAPDAEHFRNASSEVIADALVRYFQAFGYAAALNQYSIDKELLVARFTGVWHFLSYFCLPRRVKTYHVDNTFWYAADALGNAYEFGSEGYAVRLTAANLARRGAKQLLDMVEELDPFGAQD